MRPELFVELVAAADFVAQLPHLRLYQQN